LIFLLLLLLPPDQIKSYFHVLGGCKNVHVGHTYYLTARAETKIFCTREPLTGPKIA
jgi:hypothetical protein